MDGIRHALTQKPLLTFQQMTNVLNILQLAIFNYHSDNYCSPKIMITQKITDTQTALINWLEMYGMICEY